MADNSTTMTDDSTTTVAKEHQDEVPHDIVDAFMDADEQPSSDLRVVPAPDWTTRAGPPDYSVALNANTDAETQTCSYPKTPIVSKTPISWEAISTSKRLMGLHENKPPKGTCVHLPEYFPEFTAPYVVPILELFGALDNDETRDGFEKDRQDIEDRADQVFDRCVYWQCRDEFREIDNEKRDTMFQVCNVLKSLESAKMESCLLHAGKIQSDKLNELMEKIDNENEAEGMKAVQDIFFFTAQPDPSSEEAKEDLDKLEQMAKANSDNMEAA